MGEDYKFQSGRKLYGNGGYFGINEKLEICGGYDGEIEIYPTEYTEFSYGDLIRELGWENAAGNMLNVDDGVEFANAMIDRWSRFRDEIQKIKDKEL